MPAASPDEQAASLYTTSTQSDIDSLAAETVPSTVMAEQVSHHVVNQSESASAEALADVAANTNNIDIAGNGSISQPTTTTDGTSTISHADTLTEPAKGDTAASTAEPSAGEAAASASSISAADPLEEQAKAVDGGLVNGVHDGEGQAEDGSAGDGSVDHSVNSDTEGSRGDGTEQKKEGNHHVRTNSVKKPTTFSRVSVTKSFMAKTASPAPTAAAVGVKPSPLSAAVQPAAAAARPRLVAKTGALKTMVKPRAGSESASGPDASKVWNKNRPVAPPPPKQFTDEELKQQYGIHLATRLQSDEGGKESKWADIDEDEEDWAPETVVWMDGTKSTITPSEMAPPQLEQQPATPQLAKPAEGAKPSLAVKRPSESGPPKTILKPGIVALQAKQQNGATAAAPSSDKPSLKAKSPAPAPSRSPWAALPPVDAVSPIIPPTQQSSQPTQQVSLPSQDARSYEPQPPPQPAREIAADTFERSWREGEGAPRELFNSANGRYEPAPEGRRSSVKPDKSLGKPAVLQRPSQAGQSPAEPSAAFQTRSDSQVGGSHAHRRGSSVSQSSFQSGRRMSVSRPPDLPPTQERQRRQSTVIGHDMRASPKLARNEPVKPTFTQQSTWDQQMPPKPDAGVESEPTEDPVKAQDRIMREKREEAKKRRQEAEEKENQEKAERLKARLATLEGAGKSRKEREAEAAASAAAAKARAAEKPSEPPAAPAERPSAPLKPAEASAAAAPALEDQSLPPPPPVAAPQQPPIEEELPSPLPSKPQQPAGLPERPTSSAEQAQRQAPRAHLSPRANARAPFGQQSSPYRQPSSSYSSPGDRKQQPFGRSPLTNSDAFSGWNTTAPNGNVWGTSGIGNGTFDKASSFAPMPMSQQNLPPPPGMGRPSPSSNRISPQAIGQDARSPSLQQQQLADQQRTFPPPGIESRPETGWGQSRGKGVSPAPGLGRQTHLPGPIAPPSRAQQAPQPPVQRPDPLSAWNNAAARLPHQYAAEANAAERKQQEAAPPPPREDTFNETFKQTSATQGRLGGPRRFDKTEYTIHDAQGSRSVSALSPAPPSTQTQPIGPVPTASPLNDPWKQASENTVRIPDGSLNPAHGGLQTQQPPIGPPSAQQAPPAAYHSNVNFTTGPLPSVVPAAKEQSPPPPETSSHPANDGDIQHPNVRLPPPPPRVKLPPGPAQMQTPMQQPPVQMPQRPVQVWGPPGVARPLVMNEDWQARFNGLFNRASIATEVPPSPPGTPPKAQQGPVLAVAASSRAAMDEMPAAVSATVSLPQSAARKSTTIDGFTIDDSDDVVSKPTIDQMFNEELSFGSLPKVSVPQHATYDPEVYSNSKHNMLKMPANSKFQRPVDAQTGVDLTAGHNLTYFFHKHPQGYFVKVPGTKLSNKLVKAAVAGSRKASAMQERKASGKFSGPKAGKEAKGNSNKDSGASSPVTNGTPNAGSRKASFQQKASVPAPAAVPASPASPANAENNGGKKQGKWTRRNAPIKAS